MELYQFLNIAYLFTLHKILFVLFFLFYDNVHFVSIFSSVFAINHYQWFE